METKDVEKKNTNSYKIVTYILTFLITITLLVNSREVATLNFFAKAIVYIVVFIGGILGGSFGTWLNERFPYPLHYIAIKFNLQDSTWFSRIGAQLVGVIAGIIVFGGIIAGIFGIKI